MRELPKGWEWSTLGEVGDIQLGRQRSPKNHKGPHMRPYLRSANVTWGGIDLTDVKEMNFEPTEATTFELEFGDLLLNEASGSPNEVGKPAIWRGEISGCCFQNTLLRVRSRHLSTEFLYWYCRSNALNGKFGEAGRGVSIRHLGKQGLASFPLRLPPAGEQERIVAAIEEHLSRLDVASRSLASAERRLDALDLRTIDEAFRAFKERVPIGECAEVRGGIQKQPKRRPKENRAPFLRVANVGRGRLDLADVHEIEIFNGEIDRYRLEPGDLLVVEGNGSADQIGRSAVWGGEMENCVHQNHLIRVRPGPSLNPEFLGLYWNAPSTRARLTAVASSTSGLHTLSTAKVKRVEVPVPSLADQAKTVGRLVAQIEAIERLRAELHMAKARLMSLRRSILSAAFSGRLVPQDPDDEPAAVLLERIRAERAAAPKARRRTRKAAP